MAAKSPIRDHTSPREVLKAAATTFRAVPENAWLIARHPLGGGQFGSSTGLPFSPLTAGMSQAGTFNRCTAFPT